MSELQRVLAALDAGTATIKYGDAMADAARVIRELAADFKEWAGRARTHKYNCAQERPVPRGPCTCGLDAAREKWRLEP